MRSKDIMAGVVTAIVMIASTVSYSAAIFSGPLAAFLSVGIGYGLVGGAITAAIFSLRSGIPFAIAGPDSKPTAVLAALATSVALASRTTLGTSDGQASAALALLALLVATALTGLVLYLFGRWQVGRWVRFVPFPVVGGFMAASGWLLAMGAVRLLTRVEPTWSTLGALATPSRLEQLAAGILFAGALALAARSKYVLSFPALLLGVTLLAHLVRHALGVSVEDARAAGWLLQVPSHAVLPIVWLAQHWQGPQAGALLHQGGAYVALSWLRPSPCCWESPPSKSTRTWLKILM